MNIVALYQNSSNVGEVMESPRPRYQRKDSVAFVKAMASGRISAEVEQAAHIGSQSGLSAGKNHLKEFFLENFAGMIHAFGVQSFLRRSFPASREVAALVGVNVVSM